MTDTGGHPGWDPSCYDVVWDRPSERAADGMPCGGGDVGLVVWVQDGDLLGYVDRSGSFDENNQMLKLGRFRLSCRPNPFTAATGFRQHLHLATGHVEVAAVGPDGPVLVRVWVEVDRPVVHLEVRAERPVAARLGWESWRVEDRALDAGDRSACFGFASSDPTLIPLTTRADRFAVLTDAGGDRVHSWHHNRTDDLATAKMLTIQHLDHVADSIEDPLRDRVFGAAVTGAGFSFGGTYTGRHEQTRYTGWQLSRGADRHHDLVLALPACTGDVADWRSEADRLLADPGDRSATVGWWEAFWRRSSIQVQPGAGSADRRWRVGRNYQLFRYLLGCNATGRHPSKFNGSLFTVDPELTAQNDRPDRTPDFRAWGGGSITAQNQRLIYFTTLPAGDVDLLVAQLEFYRRALPGATIRTREAWGHAGASFAEQLEPNGLPCGSVYEYGFGGRGVVPRPGEDVGALANEWCRDQYDTVLEFALLALDAERYAGLDIARYLPFIDGAITFFDEHYRMLERRRRGADLRSGRLVIDPGSACESYKDARDPAPTVAGLRVVLQRLLELPDDVTGAAERERWRRIVRSLPELPLRTVDGRRVLAPAASWSHLQNWELPQLYPVFPWGLFGPGRPDRQLAVDTFRHGHDHPDQRGVDGWRQDPIFAAVLQLTDEAAEMVATKLDDAPRRFPTFWGPNFDWTPDFDHGSSAAIALQRMLLHCDGATIHLLPAWPPGWDVDFRLHAAYGTVVEAGVVDGELRRLRVEPPDREIDLVVHPPYSVPVQRDRERATRGRGGATDPDPG